MIFRIVCQISGQDNVSYKIQKLAFSDQKVLFLLFKLKEKLTVKIFVLTRVLFVTRIITIALLSKNSTNSLKVETKTKQSCKILIDILWLPSTTVNTLNAIVKFFSSVKMNTFAKSPGYHLGCHIQF